MASAGRETIAVEVVHARPERQVLRELELTPPVTAIEAVERSRILRDFPDLVGQELSLGVWGRAVPHAHRLQAGDRVEIYRPLIVEPRERRRAMAGKGPASG
jgi:hypothetical protein